MNNPHTRATTKQISAKYDVGAFSILVHLDPKAPEFVFVSALGRLRESFFAELCFGFWLPSRLLFPLVNVFS